MANKAFWKSQIDEKAKPVTFHVGDTIRVHYRLIEKEKEAGKAKRQVIEKERERIQVFEGIVIAIRGSQENTSFKVRKIASGAIGVERIFPLISPWIKNIEIKKLGKVRRAKLYYLKERKGKAATKIKEKVKYVAKKIKTTPKKAKITPKKTKKTAPKAKASASGGTRGRPRKKVSSKK